MGAYFVLTITIILVSGLIAGVICKRLKASPLIGYLVVGALIGPGGFDLTGSGAIEKALKSDEAYLKKVEKDKAASEEQLAEQRLDATKKQQEREERLSSRVFPRTAEEENFELKEELAAKTEELAASESRYAVEHNARERDETVAEIKSGRFALEAATEFGVLLLLFAIGIEFTFAQLAATAKYMFIGGTLQMGATIGVCMVMCLIFKMGWVAGLAIGSVVALSSTALVYKSLTDFGQADTKRAQATLGLLIFQDVALVPLLLILPIILGGSDGEDVSYLFNNPWIDMALRSIAFCAIVLLIKYANMRFIIERLAALRTNDMVILYAVVVLLGMCVVAEALGLTAALGALAAGIALGENRLTRQIDALILPFREAFSAMFFISLGMLTDFSYVFHHPFVCLATLACCIALKAICSTAALRACGMDARGALAFGVSISQIGELAFMLLTIAFEKNAFEESVYNTMLFVSVASLVLTPNMIKIAMTKFGMPPEEHEISGADSDLDPKLYQAIANSRGHAIIVGAGHIGQTIANEMLAHNISVCVVDFNPVNLHPFNQNGVPTVTGDGANYDVLRQAGIGRASTVLVTVPRDDLAINVVKSVRALNPSVIIASRSRYRLNVPKLEREGAALVLCEENFVADELVKLLLAHLNGNPTKSSEKPSQQGAEPVPA